MQLPIPKPLLTDSYKLSHFSIYASSQKQICYSEFRKPLGFGKTFEDERIVVFGIRYLVEQLQKKFTLEELNESLHFASTHNLNYSQFPFPKDLFLKFITENNGYFPIKVEAILDGSVVYPHTPILQITANYPYAALTTYWEPIFSMLWYPCTVATLSRHSKHLIQSYFEKTADSLHLLNSRLHDFGLRGCTNIQQAVIGGSAHLLSFDGSDTLPASYTVQKLNNDCPIATSIPATEHSIMTSHKSEIDAYNVMIDEYGEGMFACVMDSYDYIDALDKILPAIAAHKLEKGGFMVIRPDSGDPLETVLQALHAAEKVFGCRVNSKGFKIITGASVIQGDGIDYDKIKVILQGVMDQGYSVENVAFGMGGGLLQKVNRDSMSFATKLSHIVYEDGSFKDVMKMPKTVNFPWIEKDEKGLRSVHPAETPGPNDFVVVYNSGPVDLSLANFSETRARLEQEWQATNSFGKYDPISKELRFKISEQKNA